MSDVAQPAEPVVPAALSFAQHFPADCPPGNAEDAAGTVYRLVTQAPLIADDFDTFHEMGRILQGRECECCGVSVFRDLDDAFAYSEKFPHLGELVATATLQPEHGRTRLTPRPAGASHTTWWPYLGVERSSIFALVAEEGQ